MNDEVQPVEVAPAAELWLSLSKLAVIKGVSVAAISKRVLKLEQDGLVKTRKVDREKQVNLVEFDRAIGANTDPAQELRNNGHIAKPTLAPSPAPSSSASVDADAGDVSKPQYSAARALRESYEAENSRLDLEARVGRLVDKNEVEERTMRIFRRARDRFQSLPAVVAPRIFRAPDERTARQIMDQEVRKLLTALADDLDHSGDVDEIDDDQAQTEREDVSDAAAGDRSTA